MFFSQINIRKTLTYLFLGVLILSFYALFWNDLSSVWQKITIFITAIFLFSLIKDFIFWIFSTLSGTWAFIFKSIATIFGFITAWSYIFTHYSDDIFKTRHIEIQNDIRSFFTLPTSSPFTEKRDDILIVPSSTEAKRDTLVEFLLDNTKNTESTESTENLQNTEENSTNNSNNNDEKIELQFINDAEKNWKTPLQKELQEDQGLIFSQKIHSSVDLSKYTPTANATKNDEQSEKNTTNYIYFTQTPVQVSYPQNYTFQNTTNTTTKETGHIESITTNLVNSITQETEAQITYNIYTTGKIYDKYVKQFTTAPSQTSNTFYIESTTPNSATYVTFFAGKCWVITITKESKNNTLDDFYKVLIPAVFEAQD